MYKCVISSCIYLVNNFYKQPVCFFDRNYISSLKEDSRIKAVRAESSRSAFVSGKLFDPVAEWGFTKGMCKGATVNYLASLSPRSSSNNSSSTSSNTEYNNAVFIYHLFLSLSFHYPNCSRSLFLIVIGSIAGKIIVTPHSCFREVDDCVMMASTFCFLPISWAPRSAIR